MQRTHTTRRRHTWGHMEDGGAHSQQLVGPTHTEDFTRQSKKYTSAGNRHLALPATVAVDLQPKRMPRGNDRPWRGSCPIEQPEGCQVRATHLVCNSASHVASKRR
ncbi:hypothetical protein AAC387_Pa05g2200 [Persea americana]